MFKKKIDEKSVLIVVSICLYLIALALRVSGSDYGYLHGDERINFAAKVLTGQLVPDQHFYPPLINYVNAVALIGLFGFGLLADLWSSPGEFRAAYFDDPTLFYVTARYVTAAISALMAPLFFAFARQAKLEPRVAFWVGLMGALFPLGVFMAHIAKGDSALAVTVVAVFYCLWRRVEAQQPGRWDLLAGTSVTLAVSFKQSAVFILGPLAVGWVIVLLLREGSRQCLASAWRVGLVVLILWPILNVGILLDLNNFLDYQKIQSVMSIQETESVLVGLSTLVVRSVDLYWGLNPVMAVLVFLTPLALLARKTIPIPNRDVLWAIWGALIVSSVVTAYLVGSRQPEHLWIANFAGFLLLGCLILGAAAKTNRSLRLAALGVGGLSTLLSVLGAGVVVNQALTTPLTKDLETYLNDNFKEERILTSQPLKLQQHTQAKAMEIQRLKRLAAKYNVELPAMADERETENLDSQAVFFVNAPTVMFGLENVDEDGITYEVKAHSWPLQKDEWRLEHWQNKGFTIFVVRDLDNILTEVSPALLREYYRTVVEQCHILQTFEAKKTLYLERSVTIFQC